MYEQKRKTPKVRVSDLAPVLANDRSCLKRPWVYAHWNYPQNYSTKSIEDWETDELDFLSPEHSEHLQTVLALRRGFQIESKVFMEGQNWWEWPAIFNLNIELVGQPDLITLAPNRVIEVKTGKRRSADTVQLWIYLMAVYSGKVKIASGIKGEFEGFLYYSQNAPEPSLIPIPYPHPEFIQSMQQTLTLIADKSEPPASPNEFECAKCQVSRCPNRLSKH